mmetsp:Transcript_88037/g.247453  ORF Transcript_88037/g.247453 Transcript_88037/m.247453 type:complete len:205 (-) Transcript_88037:1163-1777(-)
MATWCNEGCTKPAQLLGGLSAGTLAGGDVAASDSKATSVKSRKSENSRKLSAHPSGVARTAGAATSTRQSLGSSRCSSMGFCRSSAPPSVLCCASITAGTVMHSSSSPPAPCWESHRSAASGGEFDLQLPSGPEGWLSAVPSSSKFLGFARRSAHCRTRQTPKQHTSASPMPRKIANSSPAPVGPSSLDCWPSSTAARSADKFE